MPVPRWPPGNGLSRSFRGWSETHRERGSAVGVLYRGQVGAGRVRCREHDERAGGAVRGVLGRGQVGASRAGRREHDGPVGGTGYERGTLGVGGDVLLWVALQASLMAERFADGAGDSEGGIRVSELVGASHVGEHTADGDFGLCRA